MEKSSVESRQLKVNRYGSQPGSCTDRYSSKFKNNYFTEMCSGSEAGSYLRLIDFVYHSTLGLRVMTKRREEGSGFRVRVRNGVWFVVCGLWFVVCGLWFVVCGLRFGVWGLGFGVQRVGFRVQSLTFRVQGSRFRV